MKKITFIFVGLLLLFTVQTVNAPVDISQTPQALSDALNISLFASQVIISTLVVCFFLFPTMLLTNKRSNQYVAVSMVGIMALCVCVAIGWLSIFVLLLISLLIASMFAVKMKGVMD